MTGTGNYAELIEKRFDIACRRFGLNGHGAGREPPELDCSRFRPPSPGRSAKVVLMRMHRSRPGLGLGRGDRLAVAHALAAAGRRASTATSSAISRAYGAADVLVLRCSTASAPRALLHASASSPWASASSSCRAGSATARFECCDMVANTLGVLLGWAAALFLPQASASLEHARRAAARRRRSCRRSRACRRPGVLLVAFQSMVSVGDTYFVGRLGTAPLAGLALVFPLIMLLQMTSAGAMGGGVSSAIARALGAGDAAGGAPAGGARAGHRRRHGRRRSPSSFSRFGPAALPPARRRGRDASRNALAYSQHHLRRRDHGVDRQHALQRAARHRQHAGAGADADRRRAACTCRSPADAGARASASPAPASPTSPPSASPALAMALIVFRRSSRCGRSAATGGSSGACSARSCASAPSRSLNALQTVLTAVILTGFVGRYGAAALAGYGVGLRLELLQIPLVFAVGQALVVLVGTQHRRRPRGARQAHRLDRRRASPRRSASPSAWRWRCSRSPGSACSAPTRRCSTAARATCAPWRRSIRCSPRASRSTSPRRAPGRVLPPVLAGTVRLALVIAGGAGRCFAARPLRGDRGCDDRVRRADHLVRRRTHEMEIA